MKGTVEAEEMAGREAKRQRVGSPRSVPGCDRDGNSSRDNTEHKMCRKVSSAAAAAQWAQTQAEADQAWHRSNRFQPGGALALPHLRLVRLFVSPSATDAGELKISYRSPEHILRSLFFDPRRYAGRGIDAIHVERCLLKAILWQHYAPDRQLPDNLSRGLLPSAELRAALQTFASWPVKKAGVSMDNALRSLNIDLEALSEAIGLGGGTGTMDPLDGTDGYEEHSKMLRRLAHWFVRKSSDSDKMWRLWQNKVMALAVLRLVFKDKKDAVMPDASVVSFELLRDFPYEILKNIALFFDGGSSQRFAAASHGGRRIIDSLPNVRGRWRRHLYFAYANNIDTRKWTWNVSVAEDCPFPDGIAPLAPRPALCKSGNFCHHKIERIRNNLSATMTAKEHGSRIVAQTQIPSLSRHNPALHRFEYMEPAAIFSFKCSNPFSANPSRNPIVFRGVMINATTCVIAAVGKSDKGGFIGAGYGICPLIDRGLPSAICRTIWADLMKKISFCFRFLPPTDVRLDWTLDRLLRQIAIQYCDENTTTWDKSKDMSHIKPWKAVIFRVNMTSCFPREKQIAIPQHSCHPQPCFDLKCRLVCDLSCEINYIIEFMTEARDNGIPGLCIECEEILFSDPEVSLPRVSGKWNYNVSTSLRASKHFDVPGMNIILDKLESERIWLCSENCFFRCVSMEAVRSGIDLETNISWKNQCWGCGSVSNNALNDAIIVKYFHDCSPWNEYGYLLSDIPDEEKGAVFCSKDCCCRTVPKILNVCRMWQKHSFTIGMRDLTLSLTGWMAHDKHVDASIFNALASHGWVRDKHHLWRNGTAAWKGRI